MANYIIIGGDGKEYGPIPGEELRKWILEKRVNGQTRARAEDMTEWQAVAQLPEFAGVFPATPPPLPPSAPVAEGRASRLAVTSLVLGILGLACGLTAIPGLIIGIIALVKISKSHGALRGQGLAIAGTILSGVFLLLIPLMAAMMLPALAAAKNKAQEITCMNNERQLVLGVKMFSGDHTNHFPAAATWCDSIKATVGSDRVFKCAAVKTDNRCDYAFNAQLDGLEESAVNPLTVMFFESDQGWNASGGPELLTALLRHGRSGNQVLNVAFVDGHVERVPLSRINSLRWNP